MNIGLGRENKIKVWTPRTLDLMEKIFAVDLWAGILFLLVVEKVYGRKADKTLATKSTKYLYGSRFCGYLYGVDSGRKFKRMNER